MNCKLGIFHINFEHLVTSVFSESVVLVYREFSEFKVTACS